VRFVEGFVWAVHMKRGEGQVEHKTFGICAIKKTRYIQAECFSYQAKGILETGTLDKFQ
jgi:hypothetical protein